MSASRFVVGIDLGTTNSALAYVDTGAGDEPTLAASADPAGRRSRASSRSGRCCRRSCTCPGPNEQPAGALKLPWDARARLRRRRVRPQLRQPGADAAGRVGEVVAVPPGVDRTAADPAVEGAGRRPQASRRSRRRTLLPQAPRRGLEPPHRQGRRRAPAREAGRHPDRAGVVRRRGPRADRRGRPRRRAGERHAAGGAAGRVLRLARRQRRRLARSRSRSATSSWSATSAAAPPTSP